DGLRSDAGQPAYPAAGGGRPVRYLRHPARCAGVDGLGRSRVRLHPARGGVDRHHRRGGWAHLDLRHLQAGTGSAGAHCRGGLTQLRTVSTTEMIIFPLVLLLLSSLLLRDAAPLVGMFCFDTARRECGVVARLADTSRDALINIVAIALGLAVGSKLSAGAFL